MWLIEWIKTWNSYTDNGALTNESSLNSGLDLFFLAWASRNMSEKDITSMFSKVLAEDKNVALKILFWARDVRGWAWERRIFRIILKYIANKDRELFNKLLPYLAEYWRYDDLFFDSDILEFTIDYIKNLINQWDKNELWLLFKWLPREKSKNKKIARIISKKLSLSSKQYRKLLAKNSNTVEQAISSNQWESIEYSKIPSKAFNLYRNAFKRHDTDRFDRFIESVNNWDEKINAWAIFPTDIYRSSQGWGDRSSVVAQWNALPDYLNDEDILPVCDTSWSMSWEPMDVSISLWVYLSERSKWKFKDNFITFEWRPRLQSLSWDCVDRFQQIRRAWSDMSTNIQWVFDLLLSVAERDSLSQEDLPSKLLIISDMEFNVADNDYWGKIPKTNFQVIKDKFEKAWYRMPWLIFWNVNGRPWNVPVQASDRNVALVSGYSPSIVKSVLGWEDLTPMWVMMKTLNNERYEFIDKII